MANPCKWGIDPASSIQWGIREDNREGRNRLKWLGKEGLGSDNEHVERTLRIHKKKANWTEPHTQHRWNTQEARAASMKVKNRHKFTSEQAKEARQQVKNPYRPTSEQARKAAMRRWHPEG